MPALLSAYESVFLQVTSHALLTRLVASFCHEHVEQIFFKKKKKKAHLFEFKVKFTSARIFSGNRVGPDGCVTKRTPLMYSALQPCFVLSLSSSRCG